MTFPIQISEQSGVRYLHFNSDWIQGAMRIARPWSLELAYTREMMASLLLRENTNLPRRVLLIGLGAASLLKAVPAAAQAARDRGAPFALAILGRLAMESDRAAVRRYAEGFGWAATSQAQLDLFRLLSAQTLGASP